MCIASTPREKLDPIKHRFPDLNYSSFEHSNLIALANSIANSDEVLISLLFAFSRDLVVWGRGLQKLQDLASFLGKYGLEGETLHRKYKQMILSKRKYHHSGSNIPSGDPPLDDITESLVNMEINENEKPPKTLSRCSLANVIVRMLCLTTSELFKHNLYYLTIDEINQTPFGCSSRDKGTVLVAATETFIKLRKEYLKNEVNVMRSLHDPFEVDQVLLKLHEEHGEKVFNIANACLAREIDSIIWHKILPPQQEHKDHQELVQTVKREEFQYIQEKDEKWAEALCSPGTLENILVALQYIVEPSDIIKLIPKGAEDLSFDYRRLTYYQLGKLWTETTSLELTSQEQSDTSRFKIAQICLQMIPANRSAALVFARCLNRELADCIACVTARSCSMSRKTKDMLVDELLGLWLKRRSC